MKNRLLFYLLLLVSSAWAHASQAATITTSVLNGPNFCQSTVVRVSYAVTGSFDPNNVFTAQLSDETGSFAAPVAIGSLAGTAGGHHQRHAAGGRGYGRGLPGAGGGLRPGHHRLG